MTLPVEDCHELPVYTEVSAEELLLGSGQSSRYDGLTPLYKRLPHGPHGLGREAVARHQRARLYGGMAESVYQRGYGATSVAHVIALAGVSRRAFYEQFSNKEDCFLATYDALVGASRKRVLQAWMGERGWANRLYAATQVFLEGIARVRARCRDRLQPDARRDHTTAACTACDRGRGPFRGAQARA
jgi:AcrR family transcriptional regulator